MNSYIKRWVITHKSDSTRLRQLTLAQQGRHTFDSFEHGSVALNNYLEGFKKVLSDNEFKTLAVIEVDCYSAHHDPVRYYYGEKK